MMLIERFSLHFYLQESKHPLLHISPTRILISLPSQHEKVLPINQSNEKNHMFELCIDIQNDD